MIYAVLHVEDRRGRRTELGGEYTTDPKGLCEAKAAELRAKGWSNAVVSAFGNGRTLWRVAV